MAGLELGYSKRRVDRAADVWRRGVTGEKFDVDEMLEALQIVEHFRACHQYPLTKATAGLRSTVGTVGAPVQVSQRLKRYPTILDKLVREPTMQLSRMQDIGGCRAVVPDIATMRLVQRRLERRRGYVRTAD
jgi:putative GTP pyrophosphokinase